MSVNDKKTHIENKLLHDTKNYSALRLMALDKLNKGIIDVPSLEEIYINATSCPEGNEGPKVPVWIAEKCLLIEIYKGICNIERLLNLLITNRDNDRGKRNSNSEN